jgi:hypothetical protein
MTVCKEAVDSMWPCSQSRQTSMWILGLGAASGDGDDTLSG